MPLNPLSRLSQIQKYALAHKVSTGVVVIAILGGGYFAYARATAKPAQTTYVMGTVATGTIIASLSESGQVSTTNTASVQAQVSGQITYVGVKAGQRVRAGQVIATIDSTTARQALESAKRQLAADQLTYQQSAAQAPISYQNDQTALTTAKQNLQDDYNGTYNDLTTTYLDLPGAMTQSNDALYGYDLDARKSYDNADYLYNQVLGTTDVNPAASSAAVESFMTGSKRDYASAKTSYDAALSAYQTTARTSDNAALDSLLAQSTTMATAIAQALQTELNFLSAVSDFSQAYSIRLPASFTALQSSTRAELATVNSDLTTLLNDKKTLDSAKQAITTAQQTLTLAQVGNPNGDNPISLQVSANSIAKEQQDIANQEQNLAYYTVTAPFSGVISSVSAQVGNNASGNLAAIVSDSQIANLSVNEVDAAKVKVGQKTTLTFDAVDGLSLTGTVDSINPVGTVSQGVVSYQVQLSFDTQDPRVLPGMTINAAIQTGIAQDTLVVPASAVKTATGGSSYVLAFNPPIPRSAIAAAGSQGITSATPPIQIPVTTGLSDGTNVQILSGLTGGAQIVTSTRAGSATPTAAASATSRMGGGGLGGGGGAIRIGG